MQERPVVQSNLIMQQNQPKVAEVSLKEDKDDLKYKVLTKLKENGKIVVLHGMVVQKNVCNAQKSTK